MLYPNTVRRIARRTIAQTDSFISSSRLLNQLAASPMARPTETIVGVYINDSESHTVVYEEGLEVASGTKSRFVQYADIKQIDEPGDTDFDLDLFIENDDLYDVQCISIPVRGITNDISDIDQFYDFIQEVLTFFPDDPITARRVSSRQDLIAFLRKECEWEEYTGALANYLDERFEFLLLREKMDLDKSIFERPDFWRALAIILNVPMRQPVDEVRDGI